LDCANLEVIYRDIRQAEKRGALQLRDTDRIVAIVRGFYPDVSCHQLTVKHPGVDDDGLWFFTRPGISNEVQIESSDGMCPFLIEQNKSSERRTGDTPENVAKTILEWLA
jgi:hypothetical protein